VLSDTVIGEVEEIVIGGVLSNQFAEITFTFECTDILNLITNEARRQCYTDLPLAATHGPTASRKGG